MSRRDRSGPQDPHDAPLQVGGFVIGDSEFRALSKLIYEKAGIILNESKKQLVASRLSRRLRALGLTTYRDYYLRVTEQDPDGSETREMLNCITTNKTDFFREKHHFEFMKSKVFPEALERPRRGEPRLLRIWSAGCSTGEEPYTIAMTLLTGFDAHPGWRFEVVATDIDTQVLARAQEGVYAEDVIGPVPAEMRRRFFKRGTGANAGMVRVTDELRQIVSFGQLNLIETPWRVSGPFDLVFCRNTLIYFDRDTQKRIVEGFAGLLREDGYLFLGHSESLQYQMNLFEPLRGTVYRLRGLAERGQAPAPDPRAAGARPAADPPAAAAAAPAPDPPAAGARPAPDPPAAAARPATAARAAGPTAARARPAARPPSKVRERLAAVAAANRVMSLSHPGGRDEPRVNVTIGGVRASAEPVQLRTVLGSCVCACLFDPVARVGGINHFMLPDGLEDGELPTRYGVNAMEMLINDIAKLGGDRRRLEAKAFGAAHVLVKAGLSPDVPRKNAQFIKEFLATEGIPLVSQRLGGSAPVEVLFHTATGKALVRPLGSNMLAHLAHEESQFDLEVRKQLQKPREDDVVLFDEAA